LENKEKKILPETIQEVKELQKELVVQEGLLLEKSLASNDPHEIIKAKTFIHEMEKKNDDSKSYITDPFLYFNSLGYKDKPVSLSYDVLRQMSRTYVIKSIIETRKDQVSRFSHFTESDQEEGWTIRKRKKPFMAEEDIKMSSKDRKRAADIASFVQNAGNLDNKWKRDDFDTFLRKLTKDSLEIDQATFEVVRDRRGNLVEYFVTDGATYRIADNYDRNGNLKAGVIVKNGYEPAYVQVYENQIYAEFYPWELNFGIRNRSTSVLNNGYGISELEDLIRIVTWILNGDEYNGNFFLQGAAPKGILKVAGNVSQNMLSQLRQDWYDKLAGVRNAHKTPVIQSDKMDWIDLQGKNTDMQFQQWSNYLRVISCAVYKIDPQEVGFYDSSKGSSGWGGESGKADSLQHSKEKGLVPLLRSHERWIDKMLVSELDDTFEFAFTGVKPEDEEKILESDIKKVSSFMGVNEVRKSRGLPPIDKKDFIMNPTYMQKLQMDQMGSPESNEAVDEMTGESEGNMYNDNPFEVQEPEVEASVMDQINKATEDLLKGLNN